MYFMLNCKYLAQLKTRILMGYLVLATPKKKICALIFLSLHDDICYHCRVSI